MPMFMLSPAVDIKESDLTNIIPQVAASIGGLAGDFTWGPIGEIVNVSDKKRLVELFGKPTVENAQDFFSAHSFLNYTNSLRIVRTKRTDPLNATAGESTTKGHLIENSQVYEDHHYPTSITILDEFAARYAGTLGNGLYITFCLANQTAFDTWQYMPPGGTPSNPSAVPIPIIGDEVYLSRYFTHAPNTSDYCKEQGMSNDEIHIIIIDNEGKFTGTPGTILERYEFLSLCPDAHHKDGSPLFYVDVLKNKSKFVYGVGYGNSGDILFDAAAGMDVDTLKALTPPRTEYFDGSGDASAEYFFSGGDNGTKSTADFLSQKMEGFNLFRNTTEVDVNLLIAGEMPEPEANSIAFSNWLLQVAEERRDCIALLSPPVSESQYYRNPTSIVNYTNLITSSSYGAMDSCALRIYDEYNNLYRWIPANGTVAGLCANAELVAEPWFPPAGFNRGQIKNISKISYNPDRMDRDDLYQARINPIVQFAGEGTVLFGDKTLLARPSAFDRINVRRLFNVLEKSISTFAKYMLFEFNDEFTRARFVNIVEPYLRNVKARRGIYAYRVVCDTNNNPPVIIDANEFVADIYIQPARSINFIRLNFIATPTGANFDEIIEGNGDGTM